MIYNNEPTIFIFRKLNYCDSRFLRQIKELYESSHFDDHLEWTVVTKNDLN